MIHRQPIKVLIVEAFEIVLHGLRYILKSTTDIQVIGEAISVESALAFCTASDPDVVLIDTSLPDMEGISALQTIYESHPFLNVIALVCPENHHLIEAVMQSEAIACLTKNITADELIRTIRLAAEGKLVMIRYSIHRHNHSGRLAENLTQREQEVLNLLTHGLTNRQIAEYLEVSRFTVKNHVSALLNKLGATSRTQAVKLALQHCLVRLDQKL